MRRAHKLPELQPSRAELLMLLDGLHLLRHLSFHTVVGLHGFTPELITLDDITALAPHFSNLLHLSFCCMRSVAVEALAVILRKIPQIQVLQLVGLVEYRAVANGCCLAVADDSVPFQRSSCDSSRMLCDCLRACPVPIVDLKVGANLALSVDALRTIAQLANHSLSQIHWELQPKSWLGTDLGQPFASCPLLTNLTLSHAWDYLYSATLLFIVQKCVHVRSCPS